MTLNRRDLIKHLSLATLGGGFLSRVERVAALFEDVGLALQPTFVASTPWITLEGY